MKESKACTQHASKHGGTQRGGRGGGGGGLSLCSYARGESPSLSSLLSSRIEIVDLRRERERGERGEGTSVSVRPREGGREAASPPLATAATGGGELGGGLAQKRVCWAASTLQWALPTRERERRRRRRPVGRGGRFGGGGGGGGRTREVFPYFSPSSLPCTLLASTGGGAPTEARTNFERPPRSQKLESVSRACSVGD